MKKLIRKSVLIVSVAVFAVVAANAQEEKLKVTFDDASNAMVVVDSNGVRYRVDPVKKTVEKIVETTAPATPSDAAATVKTTPAAADEEEESVWDFDRGYEPYDYRLINLATPKAVPKHSWNMNFSHRFSQPVNPIKESAKDLLGFDSMSVSSFSVSYGITDKLYMNASRTPLCARGMCKTIEVGVGYN